MLRYEHGGDVFAHTELELDFSVNLNPLGMPEAVKRAVVAQIGAYAGYPDPHCRALCAAIAAAEGLASGDVCCGNGAADLIWRICLAKRPKRTLLLAPGFSEYERAALFVGSAIRWHRLQEEKGFALTEDILDDIVPGVDLFFLCNPNNPTGRLAEAVLLERVAARCEKTGTLLVVDECFLAFTEGVSCKALLGRHPNLVVLDAFTKRYAMAGLRLGYILSQNHALLEAVREAGALWNVSAAATAAGLAALSCGAYVRQARALVASERARLAAALCALGFKVYPGSANYILFYSEKELQEPLLSRGILIRSCANYEGLDGGFYRVCVMRREENDILLTRLREVLHG